MTNNIFQIICALTCGLNPVTLPASVFALSTLLLLVGACERSSSPKFRQYYVQGEKLYLQHCSNCHQKNGTGLGRLYPPLTNSDYMNDNFEDVICLMRHGVSGELVVNGKQYNQPMPGIKDLTDLEIAEIATYIYNTWGNDKGIVEVRDVSPIMKKCDP